MGTHADNTSTANTQDNYQGKHQADPGHTTRDDAWRTTGRLRTERASK
jgi:hypothetical protein